MSDPITITIDEDKTLSALHGTPKEGDTSDLDRKLILMMHDFPGHKSAHDNLYGELEDILNAKGFHTLRFDFLGCGESSGEQEIFSLRQAKISLDALKEWAAHNKYKEFTFISNGLGSIAAILNMEISVKCQVMLWPGLNPKLLGETLPKIDKSLAELPFIKALPSLKLAPHFQDVTMPILILHGTEDDRYPISQLDLARKHMTSKRIEITTFHDGAHGLPALNHRKSMFYHITQFIEKYA